MYTINRGHCITSQGSVHKRKYKEHRNIYPPTKDKRFNHQKSKWIWLLETKYSKINILMMPQRGKADWMKERRRARRKKRGQIAHWAQTPSSFGCSKRARTYIASPFSMDLNFWRPDSCSGNVVFYYSEYEMVTTGKSFSNCACKIITATTHQKKKKK